MFDWKHGDPYGQEVRTADHLDKRDFVEEALRSRRPGATGTVVAHHDGHGLCFDVRHPDGTVGCYDPDELTPVDRGGPAPFTAEEINEVADRYPVRTELTVLAPDDPRGRIIGFEMRERNGVTIYPHNPADHPGGIHPGKLRPITSEDGLREGMEILVPGLMGGFYVMTVERDERGALLARGGCSCSSAVLEYGKDDRGCWTCVGLVNLRLVRISVGDPIP